MDNQPTSGNKDGDKKEDTNDKDSEPKVYQDGGSSDNKHANPPKP